MIKLKQLFFIAICSLVMISCGDGGPTTVTDNFDHAGQSIIDNDSLVSFLSKHYYDDVVDSIKTITSGQTALLDDTRLSSIQVTEKINDVDIDFTLYYFINRQGTPDPVKGFPTVMDSVLTLYSGEYLSSTTSRITFERRQTPTWFSLNGVIRGWSYGFTNFKGGRNVTQPGEPITFADTGKGILFIPSGLAYSNSGTGFIPANSPLVFYVELLDHVELTDHDNDGLASIFEDIDGDGDPRFDDTDQDGVPNYFDADDDGDGKPTREEDTNGDGDPRNDDADGDGIPNFLDKDS